MASRTEGGELRVLPLDRSGSREEVDVLRIRTRPAALDVSKAELVQSTGDLDLVRERDDQAFALRSIAQGCVVEDYAITHRGPAFADCSRAATTASPISCVPTGRSPAALPVAASRSCVR